MNARGKSECYDKMKDQDAILVDGIRYSRSHIINREISSYTVPNFFPFPRGVRRHIITSPMQWTYNTEADLLITTLIGDITPLHVPAWVIKKYSVSDGQSILWKDYSFFLSTPQSAPFQLLVLFLWHFSRNFLSASGRGIPWIGSLKSLLFSSNFGSSEPSTDFTFGSTDLVRTVSTLVLSAQ